MNQTAYKLSDPVSLHLRTDFNAIPASFSVGEALADIRSKGVGSKIIYFYATDSEGRLCGVLPTRRLLMASENERISSLMIPSVLSIPGNATMFDACELFVMHRFLALPVVDDDGRLAGVVDVDMFADEIINMSERRRHDEIFDAIGLRISKAQDGGAIMAFRLRFPWLLATIACGMACALLASAYETTISKSIALAFFLTLSLALGESVNVQTMTATIHALRIGRFSWPWLRKELLRQFKSGFLLGIGCSAVVFILIYFWRREAAPAFSIALSILISEVCACLFGLLIPALFHWLKRDPKIASGPISLAATDIMTLFIYLQIARFFLD